MRAVAFKAAAVFLGWHSIFAPVVTVKTCQGGARAIEKMRIKAAVGAKGSPSHLSFTDLHLARLTERPSPPKLIPFSDLNWPADEILDTLCETIADRSNQGGVQPGRAHPRWLFWEASMEAIAGNESILCMQMGISTLCPVNCEGCLYVRN